MSDVFISYARSAEGETKRLSEALRDLGYDVRRDNELPAHRDYAELIEERLRSAKAVVVVVWSAEAVKSQWVRAEADLARGAGKLVQVSFDGAPLPLPLTASSVQISPAGRGTVTIRAGTRWPRA
jgi:adenylate cyclase